jgi:Calponin homology (CH) domain
VVGAKDLPEEPSEEEFRLGLRNGLILCNALNKVHPGAVPKVRLFNCSHIAPPNLIFFLNSNVFNFKEFREQCRNLFVSSGSSESG